MITASRFGSAPLTCDWSNLGRVEPSVDAPAAWSKLKARFASGEVAFYDAPISPEISQIEATQALARKLVDLNRFTDCLFLGIGGSSLGPISLLAALEDRRKTSLRFHFLENPDPLEWKSAQAKLKPDSTLVCAITKSGTTFETLAQLMLAIEWLGEARLKTGLVAITDPKNGDLREFVTKQGVASLEIAPGLGGRFSIFSPVGLFAAALAGISCEDFLLGAKQARDWIEKTPPEKNPLFAIGSHFVQLYPKRSVHVCMPYSSRLRNLGDWFVQLWGESLGKDGKGFTPLAALGAVDQHSLLQLLRDGPDDKVTLFVTVDQVDDVKIPKLKIAQTPAFAILEGNTLHGLLRYEFQATSLVLTKRGRPNLTLQLDRLDERSMGALYFMLAVLTAVTGTLWGVNPFDQPGVEEGKVYIKNYLQSQKHPEQSQDGDAYEDENSPVNRLRRHREND